MTQVALSAIFALFSTSALATGHAHNDEDKVDTCFPKNDLHLEDRIDSVDANMTEAEFNEIVRHAKKFYAPIVRGHDATLDIQADWGDSTVNAYASRSGSTWNVQMFGGLARRPEVTKDGFALVVCHELGHHLGGFPFKGSRWAATEGQSDYFGNQACATKLWEGQATINETFRTSTPQYVREKCDAAYEGNERQNLCYRAAMAGKSLADLLAALRGSSEPDFETEDPNQVQQTVESHPEAQCRLDTYTKGALCSTEFPDDVIPGRSHPNGQSSIEAERIAASHACTQAGLHHEGRRPRCWFAPKLSLAIAAEDVRLREVDGNGDNVWDSNEIFAVNVPLVNNLLQPIEGATLEIAQFALAGGASYPTIPVGEVRYANEGIAIRSPDNRRCGDRFTLKAKAGVGQWAQEAPLEFVIGELKSAEELNATVNKTIPDYDSDGMNETLTASSEGKSHLVRIGIDIEHSYIGDLRMQLTSPDGSSYRFYERQGGGSDNINKTFEVPLSKETIAGTWTLNVADVARADIGKLKSWSLEFSSLNCDGLTLSAINR